VRNPSKEVTTYHYGVSPGLSKDSAGVYSLEIEADESGVWYYRFWSTGNGQAAEEESFRVNPAKAISAS
jgi:hypothetical protein